MCNTWTNFGVEMNSRTKIDSAGTWNAETHCVDTHNAGMHNRGIDFGVGIHSRIEIDSAKTHCA